MPPRMPASPASPLQAQRTGQLHPQTTGPRATPPRSFGTPTRQSSMMQQQQQWDVTPDAKRISDGFFAGLDKENKGYIEGEVAVPFMLQSQLDEGTLATVWYVFRLPSTAADKQGFG
jgi:epidermal growth factor receptor substrate 15